MANTPYAKATGGTPITSWLPNQLKAVMQQIQDVLDIIASLEIEMDETKFILGEVVGFKEENWSLKL